MSGSEWRAPRSHAASRRRRRWVVSVILVIAAAVLVSVAVRSCGSEDPAPSPPPVPDAMIRDQLDTWGAAVSLEVSGSLESGRSYSATGYADGRVYGTFTAGSQPVPFVRVGESDYISGSRFVWDALGVSASRQEGWVRDDAQIIGELDPLTPGSLRAGLSGTPERRGGTLLYPSGITVVLGDGDEVTGFSKGGTYSMVVSEAQTAPYTTEALDAAQTDIARAGDRGIAVVRMERGKLVVVPPAGKK